MLSAGEVDSFVAVPVLFTVVGVAFAGIGLRTLRTARRFRAVALRAPGVVTDLRYRSPRASASGTWFPVLRFLTDDGRHIETEAMYGRWPAPARRGDHVTVLFDPAQPTRAALDGEPAGRFLGAIFVVLGLLFAVLGLAMAVVLGFVSHSLRDVEGGAPGPSAGMAEVEVPRSA